MLSLLTPWRAALLCLALLLAQGLGQAHALLHAPGPAAPTTSSGHDGDWIGGSHEAGGSDCRLIDQLSHADLLWALPAALLPVVPAQAPTLPLARAALQRAAAAPYLARAPPRR